MCLNLYENTEKQIANEDIICYKRVLINFKSNFMLYDNNPFTGIIKYINCEGKIRVEDNEVYLCTNNPRLNGSDCEDKLGYNYSWAFDYQVGSIIVDGIDLMIPTEKSTFLTPYRDVEVNIGETYTSDIICIDNIVNIGLHSYAVYEDAASNLAYIIVKCIIPKGSEYYEGRFGVCKSYASNQLTYLEKVTK